MAAAAPAQAGLVDFGTGDATNHKVFTPWVQDGMTMTAIGAGGTHGAVHWDNQGLNFGASAADDAAKIHRGSNGEQVEFTYAGGAFDLDSIDIEAFILEAPSLTVTFTGSNGSIFSTSSVGGIDFSSMGGWSDLDWFTIGVPLGDYGCGGNTDDCSSVIFDNVAFTPSRLFAPASVPEPLTLSLFGAGLAGLVAVRRRRRASLPV